MLKAFDLSFSFARRYASGPRVIDGVSLDLERGTVVGLLGPNGSGKTTLLRILAGVLPPQSGRVLIDGRPIEQLARRAGGDRHGRSRDTAVRDVERRRETAGRDCRRAGAGVGHPAAGRTDDSARSRLSARDHGAASPPQYGTGRYDDRVDARLESGGGAVRADRAPQAGPRDRARHDERDADGRDHPRAV